MIGTGIGLGLSGYRLAPAGFSPPLISGLQLWLDASDLSTLYQSNGGSSATADGDPVGYWADKSGNAKHAVQASGTSKPALKLAIQNTKNVLRFDGVNDFLSIATIAFSQPYQAFFACKISSTGNIFHASGQGQVRTGTTGSISPLTDVAVFSGTPLSYANFFVSGATLLGEYVANGTNSKIYKNSILMTTGNAGTQGITGNLAIGAYNTPENFITMDLMELIIYGSELNSSNKNLVEEYLNIKWGVY